MEMDRLVELLLLLLETPTPLHHIYEEAGDHHRDGATIRTTHSKACAVIYKNSIRALLIVIMRERIRILDTCKEPIFYSLGCDQEKLQEREDGTNSSDCYLRLLREIHNQSPPMGHTRDLQFWRSCFMSIPCCPEAQRSTFLINSSLNSLYGFFIGFWLIFGRSSTSGC